jgi:TRAP-type uncharacterized transport system substrate-binding protein
MADGEVDAVLQEAIMMPWWRQAVKQRDAVPNSPLSYPLDPVLMARPSLPLHPGARRYYSDAGYLSQGFFRSRENQSAHFIDWRKRRELERR